MIKLLCQILSELVQITQVLNEIHNAVLKLDRFSGPPKKINIGNNASDVEELIATIQRKMKQQQSAQ